MTRDGENDESDKTIENNDGDGDGNSKSDQQPPEGSVTLTSRHRHTRFGLSRRVVFTALFASKLDANSAIPSHSFVPAGHAARLRFLVSMSVTS